MRFSASAPSRLCAEETAWASPVKWTLISSSGMTRAIPPPVPPPLIPNIGPSDGSRSVVTTLLPICPSPCVSPTLVVVLPSPAGVGFTPVTTMSLPFCSGRMASSDTFAFVSPKGMRCFGAMPRLRATSPMGRSSSMQPS